LIRTSSSFFELSIAQYVNGDVQPLYRGVRSALKEASVGIVEVRTVGSIYGRGWKRR
jgi:hypothetical protein